MTRSRLCSGSLPMPEIPAAAEPTTTWVAGWRLRSFLRFFSELAGSSTDGWELVRYS